MQLNEEQIKHMVNRFLTWKLPKTFRPDGGITFEPTYKGWEGKEIEREPVGTNVFTATEATEMVKHMLEDMPE